MIKEIRVGKDGWLVNNTWFIDNKGNIWYDYYYLGYHGEFPKWLIELRDELVWKN